MQFEIAVWKHYIANHISESIYYVCLFFDAILVLRIF